MVVGSPLVLLALSIRPRYLGITMNMFEKGLYIDRHYPLPKGLVEQSLTEYYGVLHRNDHNITHYWDWRMC